MRANSYIDGKLLWRQMVLADIASYKRLALGYITEVKPGLRGYSVEILRPVPADTDSNPCHVYVEDIVAASAEDVRDYYGGLPIDFRMRQEGDNWFFATLTERHETLQTYYMQEARGELCPELPPEATVADGIKALVAAGYWAEATELLFGCKRDTWGNLLERNAFAGRLLYDALYCGRIPAWLFCRVADNHVWDCVGQTDDEIVINVFRDEILRIRQPEAGELYDLWLQSR